MMIKEMVAIVERERMVHVARRSRLDELAQGGRKMGPSERARFSFSALLQRMGRPLGRGSAPAGEGCGRQIGVNSDAARHILQSMSIARF